MGLPNVFSAVVLRPGGRAPKGLQDSSQGFNPGNPHNSARPEAHKEHGRITCDGGSGNVAWVWLQRSVSCGNWGKLIAHLASVGL